MSSSLVSPTGHRFVYEVAAVTQQEVRRWFATIHSVRNVDQSLAARRLLRETLSPPVIFNAIIE